MNRRRLKQNLRRIVGPKSFLDDSASVAAYSYDSSLQTATPDFVLLPQTTEQVSEIVSLLHREGVPYVARGAGTNLSGGSLPLRKGAVIALSRMKRILSISPENQFARVQPGVTNLELQDTLKEYGYFYAPDPASQKVSTLGGNVAENSGGPHCLKYGVTTNHILGVKLVAPEGEIIELGGETLDTPGCDMLGLFVGSEGTLGIVTEITCRILPLPRSTRTMLAVYNSTEDASQTVSDIIADGIVPATLEMMDNMVIRAVEASLHAGYPIDAAAVLIIEIDGIEGSLDGTVHDIEQICRRNNVRDVRIAQNEGERDKLWVGRRGAFGAVARLYPNYSVSDGTVPRTKLPEVLRRVEEIGCKYRLEIGNVFHAGDGNLHPLVFFDSRDQNQLERVHRAGAEILEACIAAGGTISGEHGVGCEKIKAMPLFFGPNEIELMRNIKSVLDPKNLCNPGKILPEPIEIAEGPTTPVTAASHEDAKGWRTYLPSNPDELASLIRHLRRDRKSFAPIGANTLFESLPSRGMPDAIIQSPQMQAVIEHDAANLTVTAEAWLSIGDLQDKLREAGQFLPLDAPPQATLGGIVASALPGPRRHLYGAVRDALLGLKFVSGSGQILKAGGKTVKNVAGYDFGKLLIGSWGTLGILTEITFRLVPLPKACGAFIASFQRADDACEAAHSIVAAGLNPSLITFVNAQAAAALADELMMQIPAHDYALILGAEGFDSAIQSQLSDMEQVCSEKSAKLSARIFGDEYQRTVGGITLLSYPTHQMGSSLSVRIGVPCGHAIAAIETMENFGREYETTSLTVANIAGGSVYTHFLASKEKNSPESAKRILKALTNDLVEGARHAAPTQQGSHVSCVTLLSAPDNYDGPFIIRNHTPSSWFKSIKKCFDPDGLMNPTITQW